MESGLAIRRRTGVDEGVGGEGSQVRDGGGKES